MHILPEENMVCELRGKVLELQFEHAFWNFSWAIHACLTLGNYSVLWICRIGKHVHKHLIPRWLWELSETHGCKSAWIFSVFLYDEEKSLGQAVLHAEQVCPRLRSICLAPEWSLGSVFLVHSGPRTVDQVCGGYFT